MGENQIIHQFRDPEVHLTPGKLKTYAKRNLPKALVHPTNVDRPPAADVCEALTDIEQAAMLLSDASEQARYPDEGTVKEKTAVASEYRQLAMARDRIGGWLNNDVNVNVNDNGAQMGLIKVLVHELKPVDDGLQAFEHALAKIDAEMITDITPVVVDHAAE